jgi:hypothetical protein
VSRLLQSTGLIPAAGAAPPPRSPSKRAPMEPSSGDSIWLWLPGVPRPARSRPSGGFETQLTSAQFDDRIARIRLR